MREVTGSFKCATAIIILRSNYLFLLFQCQWDRPIKKTLSQNMGTVALPPRRNPAAEGQGWHAGRWPHTPGFGFLKLPLKNALILLLRFLATFTQNDLNPFGSLCWHSRKIT